MASSTNSSAVGLEGHSTNRPPLFDGTNYQFRSRDYLMWDVVIDGHFVPMRKIRASAKANK